MEATGRYVIDTTTTPDGALIIVYDAVGQPHTPLTAFVRTVAAGQPATARAYFYALLPYFAFLDTDPVQRAAERRWDSPPGDVRAAVRAYLSRRPAGCALFLAALRRSASACTPAARRSPG